MNRADTCEIREKEKRIRNYLEKSGNEALVIGRQDNFAWFSCGGTNKVVITSELGHGYMVFTKNKSYIVAQTMDGPRVVDEELKGINVEPVFLKWCDMGREEKVSELVKGLKTVSDIPVEGACFSPSEIYKLHYPLTDMEIERCRLIGSKTEEVIRRVADEIKPGMSDYEIEAMLLYEYARCDAIPEVILVGIDERISDYRHCIPSGKKVGKTVLIHPALRMAGLHANVARMVHFGDDLPYEIEKRHEATSGIFAVAVAMCDPGRKFTDIHQKIGEMYKRLGYESEWFKHYIGGITGYMLFDGSVCFDPQAEVCINQTYDWFITITGAKTEELSFNCSSGKVIASVTGRWPTKKYHADGQVFELPRILMK